MNAPMIARPGTDAFHRERSRCIDAFAACEEAVATLFFQTGAKAGADVLAQKISSLAKIPASPGYAKARREKVIVQLSALADLLPVRADIVHGRLRLAQIDGEIFACFVNAKDLGGDYLKARLLPFENLRTLTRTVTKIAEDLRAA